MDNENSSIEMSFTDWRGNKIELGTMVVYPAKYGDAKILVEAKVIRILAKTHHNWLTGVDDTYYKVCVLPKAESIRRAWDRSRYSTPVWITNWQTIMAVTS